MTKTITAPPNIDTLPVGSDSIRTTLVSRFVRTIGIAFALCASLATAQPSGSGKATSAVRPATHTEVGERINRAAKAHPDLINVSTVGKSLLGRDLYLVHLQHKSAAKDPFKIFFYAQQHGNEVAGKDALLALVEEFATDPRLLPKDVDLYVMPMVNPDGATSDTRRNARGADLNRDHQLLEQPEVVALHEVARRIQPHIAVDCHEYGRDSEYYGKLGIMKWPLIMMDSCNAPSMPDSLTKQAERHLEAAKASMERAGVKYGRYELGGPPPDNETRHSSLDLDDGRNSLAAFGVVSFIIESGVHHKNKDPQADLGERVAAYLLLFHHFIDDTALRSSDRATVEAARRADPPPFLATNAFWGTVGLNVKNVAVLETTTGATRQVPSAMAMDKIIVKRAVQTPLAYAIVPVDASRESLDVPTTATVASHSDTGDVPVAEILKMNSTERYRGMLDRHHLAYEVLKSPKTLRAERTKLLRVEFDDDPLYDRYGGRTITDRDPAADKEFPAGTILVKIRGEGALPNPDAARAAMLLEPNILFGLSQYPTYRAYVNPKDKTIPVWRIIDAPEKSAP